MTVVAHVLGSLRPSGMEKMLVSAARYWSNDDIRHLVIAAGDDQPFMEDLRDAGYEVIVQSRSRRTVRGAVELHRVLSTQHVDIAHIHTESAYLLTVLSAFVATRQRSGRVLRTVHNIFDARGRWYVTRRLQGLIADRMVTTFTAPTHEVAELERSRFKRDVEVITNWVDDRFFELAAKRQNHPMESSGQSVCLMVGNCSPIKNHELVLEAIEDSGDLIAHVGLEDGASSREMSRLEQLDASGRIVWRGVTDPDDALLNATYFCMPSRHEGMGIALAEALVVGVPALVTDAPGLRWAVESGGVMPLGFASEDWKRAIVERAWQQIPPVDDAMAFSAARGANKYLLLYHDLTPTSRKESSR